MSYFPEEVVEQILGFVTSHSDRNSISLVCRAWYHIERLNRRSVFVSNCYAVQPEHVHVRFPSMRSLTVKGKPHFADFDLVPRGWGAKADPWVYACARSCPGLEELRLKRMVVTDECLKLVARSFENFKSLVLVSCEGFTTAGLATIATNCRFLKELDLQESIVKQRGGQHWINCFPKPSTSLESLNFACLVGEVNALELEQLVERSPNLKSLRLNRSVPVDVLARMLSRTPKLEDLGTGSFLRGYNPFSSLFNALYKCSSLKSLSGFWDASGSFLREIYSVCHNLTSLNLSYAPLIPSADLINTIHQCPKLRILWVLDNIGDEGLRVVASSCMELQELRVFPANIDVQVQPGTAVTEEGLVAISSGCRKINSVLYFCKRMTNAALITIAKNSPQFTSFRLCIIQPKSADAVTGQPLDEGFGAIVQSCKGLRRLSMSGLLTDSVFLYIGMYAEKLEMLSVAFAGDTDNGMIYVLNGCKNLKKLEIRDSPFGDAALLAGMERYESMRSLWMSSCNITLGGCKSLAASMPNLNIEVMNEASLSIDEADEDANNAKVVDKLYLYRTIAGRRGDAPGFISLL